MHDFKRIKLTCCCSSRLRVRELIVQTVLLVKYDVLSIDVGVYSCQGCDYFIFFSFSFCFFQSPACSRSWCLWTHKIISNEIFFFFPSVVCVPTHFPDSQSINSSVTQKIRYLAEHPRSLWNGWIFTLGMRWNESASCFLAIYLLFAQSVVTFLHSNKRSLISTQSNVLNWEGGRVVVTDRNYSIKSMLLFCRA